MTDEREVEEVGFDLRRALDAVGQAVIITDADGRIGFWNTAAERVFGWKAVEVLGRAVLEVTPAEHVTTDAASLLATLQAGESWTGDMLLRRRDGTTFLARVTDTPILDESGDVVGIIGVSEDVTEARWTEAELRRSEQRLRLALSAGGLGVWEWDRGTGMMECDAASHALLGFKPNSFPADVCRYLDRVHPEDQALVRAALDTVGGPDEEFRIEHRVVWPDGDIRWLENRGQRVAEEGAVRGLVGVLRDVTDERRADEERTRLLAEESAARAEADAARARLEFLAGTSTAITSTLELDDRLDRLASVGVPRFADGCAIHLLTDGAEPELITLHHVDSNKVGRLRDLLVRYPTRLDDPVGAGAAIREGRTSWLPEIGDELLQTVARDDAHLEELRALDLRAGVAVPLIGRGGPIGAVTFFTVGDRVLRRDDVKLAEELGARVGILVENGQLIRAREHDAADQRYQTALLSALYKASVDGVIVVSPDGEVLSHNERFMEMWGFDPRLPALGDDALLGVAAQKVADPEGFLVRVRSLYDAATDTTGAHDEVLLADGRIFQRHGAPLHSDDGEYFGWAWNFRDITLERIQQAEIAAAGERSAELARSLQQSLLPPRLPEPGHLDLSGRYHPALEGVEVGGDFYDVFSAGDDWVAVVGDVCGKGPDAARVTALVRYTVRAAAMRTCDPAETLVELNSAMRADGQAREDGRFATVCCVRLQSDPAGGVRARIACGGHPSPLVLRADGTVESPGAAGTLVGLFDEVDITSVSVHLAAGDSVIAVTDGVLEARDAAGVQLDEAGLVPALSALGGEPAARISEEIERLALAFQDGVARDDIAVLVARVR